MKKSDVLDRWTILRMKARLDESAAKELSDYEKEVNEMIRGQEAYNPEYADLISAMLTLMEHNAKIWVLESAIRSGASMPLEEVGRRALQIRDENKGRVAAKCQIDAYFGEIADRKVDHASQ